MALVVCLSVCLLATLLKNYWLYFLQNITRDVSLDKQDAIKYEDTETENLQQFNGTLYCLPLHQPQPLAIVFRCDLRLFIADDVTAHTTINKLTSGIFAHLALAEICCFWMLSLVMQWGLLSNLWTFVKPLWYHCVWLWNSSNVGWMLYIP